MHRFNKRVAVLLVLLISTASFGARKANYVFLFIGDGMGFSHVSLTEAYLAQQRGVIGNDPLAFTQLPVLGMATTYSASNPITCSSAAGTALATGTKTKNGMLGMDADSLPLKSIAYKIHEAGLKIGIMSTVQINHATPAAFYGHVDNRNEYDKLADQLIEAMHAEDSGRLVTFACSHINNDVSNENTDLVAFNTYPGWIGTDAGTPANLRRLISERVKNVVDRFRGLYPEKPIIVSEMGTCGVYGHHDPAGAQWTEEFEAEYVGDVIDTVFANPEICGIAIWQFTDARSYHRGGATIRSKPFAENLAGLYDGYRRAKAVVPVVQEKFRRKHER